MQLELSAVILGLEVDPIWATRSSNWSHFKQKSVHKTPFWEKKNGNWILASTTPILAKFFAQKAKILEIFSSNQFK